MKKKIIGMIGMVLALALGAQADLIATGTVIGIDFSDAEGTAANWNLVDSYSGSIAADALEDTSGVQVDGVTFTWSFDDTTVINNDGSENNTEFSGQPEFPDNVAGDWLGFNNTGSIVLTFTGLDDSLTYTIVIGAANDVDNDNADTSWSVDGGTTYVTDASVAADSYITFTGLTTDGDGTLVITGVGAGNTQYGFVSALTLEAVPEPATIGMVLAAATGLMFIRRRMAL
jgi:hypothetical protein